MGCTSDRRRDAALIIAEAASSGNWDCAHRQPQANLALDPLPGCHLRQLHEEGAVRDVVLAPIGFISEHMEVVYDLDVEAAGLCEELGIHMVRAGVIGTHPRFVAMIRELVCERIEEQPKRLALGTLGPSPDDCAGECCLTPAR
jgi:ferrochelatase